MNTRIASILHNAAVDQEGRHLGFFGYQPGQPMVVVFNAEIPTGITAIQALGLLFDEFNIGETSKAAVAYRKIHGLRSLSVGDVVKIDGQWFSCDSMGWSILESEPLIVATAAPHAWKTMEPWGDTELDGLAWSA